MVIFIDNLASALRGKGRFCEGDLSELFGYNSRRADIASVASSVKKRKVSNLEMDVGILERGLCFLRDHYVDYCNESWTYTSPVRYEEMRFFGDRFNLGVYFPFKFKVKGKVQDVPCVISSFAYYCRDHVREKFDLPERVLWVPLSYPNILGFERMLRYSGRSAYVGYERLYDEFSFLSSDIKFKVQQFMCHVVLECLCSNHIECSYFEISVDNMRDGKAVVKVNVEVPKNEHFDFFSIWLKYYFSAFKSSVLDIVYDCVKGSEGYDNYVTFQFKF